MLHLINWTDIILIHTVFFDITLWTAGYLWVGSLFFLLLKSLRNKRPFLLLTVVLLFFQMFRMLIQHFFSGTIQAITLVDLVVELLTALSGATLAILFLAVARKEKTPDKRHLLTSLNLLASLTYSFFWVGSYDYQYNVEILNNGSVNLFTFASWTIGGFLTIYVYRKITGKHFIQRISIIWISYLIILFIVEFIGYKLFGVHETSKVNSTPLVFGLIHGTPVLHLVYLISPFITIPLYILYRELTVRSLAPEKVY